MKHDCLDVTIMTENTVKAGMIDLALVDAVANGKLYLLNQNGEFEQVVVASYWKEDDLLSVCNDGYEWNENGEVTRDWR